MFSIKLLKHEIGYLNDRIKILTKHSYTDDPHANLEINDIRILINDLEESVAVLKDSHLIKGVN